MKFLVVLTALVSACVAAPSAIDASAYSSFTPYAYRSYAPPSFYAVRPVAEYGYSLTETAPVYAPAPLVSYPAPAVKYVAPAAPIVSAAPVPVPVAAPVAVPVAGPVVKNQYYSQNELGEARYGHDEPGQSHHAIQDAAGNKFGTFSYIKADGKVAITQYTADEEGYRVASNDLPIAPGAPAPAEPAVPVYPAFVAADAPIIASAPIIPAAPISPAAADAPIIASAPIIPAAPISPAAPAPEAAAAPAEASSDPSSDTIEVENAEVRAKRSVKAQEDSRDKRNAVLPNGYLADTPEVAAAKAAHFAEHAKAAASSYYSAYPYAYAGYPYGYAGYPYSAYPYSAYPYSAFPYFNSAAPTVVTADGYVADTPEVAAAKAAHFAEHAIARSRARRDTKAAEKVKRDVFHTPASTRPLVSAVPVVPAPAPAPIVYAPAPIVYRAPAPLVYSAPAPVWPAYSPYAYPYLVPAKK